MKYIITEHQNKLLMVQNVIDNCLNELRDWCDSISEYGNDEADSICHALSSISKIEVKSLTPNEKNGGIYININVYTTEESDNIYIIYHELDICINGTISDMFNLGEVNIIEEEI